MITAAGLKERTRDDLAQMAKRKGVAGWYTMRKDQLVHALLRAAKANASKTGRRASVKLTRTPSSKEAAAGKPSKRGLEAKTNGARKANGTRKTNGTRRPNGVQTANGAGKPKEPMKVTSSKAARKIQSANEQRGRLKDLSAPANGRENSSGPCKENGNGKKRKAVRDRVVLMVRDPYWLHVCWEIRPRSIERVRAAMCEMWHTA